MSFSPIEKKILTQLQRGVEIISRPFQRLEQSESEVIALLQRGLDDGWIRRFGGIFDARRLGYKSILCALTVPPEELAQKAGLVSAHPGVTHCYERTPFDRQGNYPNLWFTLAILQDQFEHDVKTLRNQLDTEQSKLLELPALHRFKIDVVFDLHTQNQAAPARAAVKPNEQPARPFTEEEKALVRSLDHQIPLVEKPFASIAAQIGQSEKWVLSTLQNWKETGALRRIGAILYHREIGFKANAMCVWPIEHDIETAGRRVAAHPEVTHCYQRPRLDAFPFDLYAMIHTNSWKDTEALFHRISTDCGLKNGNLFTSGQEFKKSSMNYFREKQ